MKTNPKKRTQKKRSFSLGCEVLRQYIEFNDEKLAYIHMRKVQKIAQEASERLVQLDALRREYQWTVDAYEDLYQ